MDKLIEQFMKLYESGAVKRFVEEMDDLSQDDKISLMWALDKGYIKDSFPTYHEMMDNLIKLPGWSKVDMDDVDSDTKVMDITDVMVMYIEKILLPKAVEAYKNKDTAKPPRKINPVSDWPGTMWTCTVATTVRLKKEPDKVYTIHKGEECRVHDVDEKNNVVAEMMEGEMENRFVRWTRGQFERNFELDTSTLDFEE
jgi:hypothetical protein